MLMYLMLLSFVLRSLWGSYVWFGGLDWLYCRLIVCIVIAIVRIMLSFVRLRRCRV